MFKIENSDLIPVHVVGILYQNYKKRLPYKKYVQVINSFCELSKYCLLTGIDSISSDTINLPDLAYTIEEHRKDIEQGRYISPTLNKR